MQRIFKPQGLDRFYRFRDLDGRAQVVLPVAMDHDVVVPPDGFAAVLETKRIADMADVFGLPMANHNTGSQVHTYATCQWGASIRDYMTCETITGTGDWMDQLLQLDGPYIRDGFVRVTEKPGLGIDLNPDVVKAHLAPGDAWWG